MSRHVAKEVGACFRAIDRLQLNGLLSPGEAAQMSRQVCKRAEKRGVGVSTRSVTSQPLLCRVRVHWCGSGGRQINRYYPAFNVHEKAAP